MVPRAISEPESTGERNGERRQARNDEHDPSHGEQLGELERRSERRDDEHSAGNPRQNPCSRREVIIGLQKPYFGQGFDTTQRTSALMKGYRVHYDLVRTDLALGTTLGVAAGMPEIAGFEWAEILRLATNLVYVEPP